MDLQAKFSGLLTTPVDGSARDDGLSTWAGGIREAYDAIKEELVAAEAVEDSCPRPTLAVLPIQKNISRNSTEVTTNQCF